MLMQPFVENAIQHGFKDINYTGELEITFKEEAEELLVVVVEDNGKGFNFAEKEKSHKSRAMQIIADRLFLYNKQHQSGAFYQVDTSLKKGFKIIVTLPKIY